MLPQSKIPYLLNAPLFQAIDPAALHDLLPYLEYIFLSGGDTLFRTGDTGDALYTVLTGRLRIIVERLDGTRKIVREVTQGESVGELALFTGRPRSATVRAIRDTELVKLSQVGFDQAIQTNPRLVRYLTKQMAERQSRGHDETLARRSIRTVTLIPLDETVPMRQFIPCFVEELKQIASTLHLSEPPTHPDAPPLDEATDGGLIAQLSALEKAHRFVIYEAHCDLSSWTQRCVRQADLIWLIAAADSEPDLQRLLALQDYFQSREATASVELVILHRHDYQPTVRVGKWRSCPWISDHHHVALARPADAKKLARILTDSSVGLVLSGGGARGFAHIGVIRALTEYGIPIDAIGGTSMGAVIAAQHALGWDWQTLVSVNRDEWPRCEPQKNYTLPIIALNSGRRMDQMLRRMFGEAEIENLRTKFFCVSTNLTRADARIHMDGKLWKAVRASVSIPGVGPPAIENGEILIDGGLIDNLPVGTMRKHCQGVVLAVDVSEQLEFKSNLAESYTVSGWKVLWQRLNPFATPMDIPSILNTLYRTTTVGSVQLIEKAKTEADVYMSPPVTAFGVFDWRSIDKIIEKGYRDAIRRLEQCGGIFDRATMEKTVLD
ncbi:MAG TPA: cyclic nucleotide-binding and patatin-like phospholipase domain-containing protein [Candidatus Binatia bacterium]|jgi:NTE family protein/lysophospholipid hydrolase